MINCAQFSANMKIFSILAKNYWKTEIELFPYGPISHENQNLSKIFFESLYKELDQDNFYSFNREKVLLPTRKKNPTTRETMFSLIPHFVLTLLSYRKASAKLTVLEPFLLLVNLSRKFSNINQLLLDSQVKVNALSPLCHLYQYHLVLPQL